MFGIGFTEILMIAVVAVIFLGPEKLPSAMADIAKMIKKAKAAFTDMKETVTSEINFDEIKKELNLDEIKNEALSYKKELMQAKEELSRVNPIDQFKSQMAKTKAEAFELEDSFNKDMQKLKDDINNKKENKKTDDTHNDIKTIQIVKQNKTQSDTNA